MRRGRFHGGISAAAFFTRLSRVHLTEPVRSCLNPDVDTGSLVVNVTRSVPKSVSFHFYMDNYIMCEAPSIACRLLI